MIKRKLKTLVRLVKESRQRPIYTVGTRNWGDREVWLEAKLKEIPNGKKILDAGAGELQYKRFCTHLDYVSQDFGQYDGQGNSEGKQTATWDNSKLDIISDIIDIPVDEKSFDAIMCIEVFEHIPQPALAVKEFARIIKPGGTVIITTPFNSLTHFAPYHFGTGYSKYWFERILEENGFEIKEITPNGNYFEYLGQETRRIEEIAREYAGYTFNRAEQKKIDEVLAMLQKLSAKDKKSYELLCFGYMVVAVKK